MNTTLRCTLLLAASTLAVGLLGCDGGDQVVEVTPRKQPANQPKIDPDGTSRSRDSSATRGR